MMLIAFFCLCILLPTRAMAKADCTYQGENVKHLSAVRHTDFCQRSQCQNGSLVLFKDDCGRDLDGSCHAVDEQFILENQLYVCSKNKSGSTYKLAPLPEGDNCTAEGRIFKHLQFLLLSDGCHIRQCQNGKIVVPKPTGTQRVYRESLYQCTEEVVDGVNTYKSVPVLPVFRNCLFEGLVYDHLQFWTASGGCQPYQCQNGDAVPIGPTCMGIDGQCYILNVQSYGEAGLVQCIYDKTWKFTLARIYEKPVPFCQTPGKDVVFILDLSGHVNADNFLRKKAFFAEVTRRFNIGNNVRNAKYLFSIIKTAAQTTRAFDFNTFLNQSSLHQGILDIGNGSETNVSGNRLDNVTENLLFDESSGSRKKAGKVVVVLTEFGDTSPVIYSITSAQADARLRNINVNTLFVEVGQPLTALQAAIGNRANVLVANSYETLYKLEDTVSHWICRAK